MKKLLLLISFCAFAYNVQAQQEFTINVSVIRYKDAIISVCPITKGKYSKYLTDGIYHKFSINIFSAEDALKLVSDGWDLKENELSKSFDSEEFEIPKPFKATIQNFIIK